MGITTFLRAGLVGLALLLPVPGFAIDIQIEKSPGGIEFWLVEEPSIPIVALEVSFRGGARLDPEGKEGLAQFFAGMLEEGAGEMDSVAFAEARADLSARIGFWGGTDNVGVGARMLVESLDPSADLLALALAEPRFDPEPFERVRAQILSNIATGTQDPDKVATRAWFAATFPDHPYGRPSGGTEASVATITRDDLVAARTRLLTRANVTISLVGAIDAARA